MNSLKFNSNIEIKFNAKTLVCMMYICLYRYIRTKEPKNEKKAKQKLRVANAPNTV